MLSHVCFQRTRWVGIACAIIATAVLLLPHDLRAQFTINGVGDRGVSNLVSTFTVVTQAGYSYSAALNSSPAPVGVKVTVTRADYYELEAWRTNLSAPFDVTNRLIRFIVQSERGDPERGLIKWSPYPVINSTAAEFAGAHLHIMTPQAFPTGLPIPVVARVDDGQDHDRRANGVITAAGFESSPIQVRRGWGSGFLPPATESGTVNYNAQLYALQNPREIQIDAGTTWTTVPAGVLAGSTTWPDNARIHVTGSVVIPAGSTLTVGAGAVVKLNPLVNITNNGSLFINGTSNQPVVFTATNVVYPEKNAGAWGGFVMRMGNAVFEANHAIFANGAGGTGWSFSPGSSHKSQQALLFVWSNSVARLTNCAILNCAGQVGNGYNGDVTLDHTLWQRAVTGGEYVGGTIIINHSAIIEFPADDGVITGAIADADYDGIYFTLGTHILMDSLLGFAKDDAIDSGSGGAGTVWVTNCWVESALHEAHAWSGEGRVASSFDTVLMNSGQGLECGWTQTVPDGSPMVFGDRILSTANSVGTRFGDNYPSIGSGFNGRLRVTNSLILHNYRDVFLKTWNAPGTGWQTNSWVDRLQQTDFRSNYTTYADARFPSSQAWNPATDGWRLTHWMTTPPEAPVGVGIAFYTNRVALSEITNGVPLRLSTFTPNFVSVDYTVVGSGGVVASGTVEFTPGETVKYTAPVVPDQNETVLELALKNPTNSELTTLSQVLFLKPPQTNPAPFTLVSKGSRWTYHDRAIDLGTAWRSNSYVEVGWSNGLAELGFGDNDEATKITSNRQTTTYFRQSFVVSDLAALTNLSLWMRRDDGGVVYLNGAEVFRSDSMPPAPFAITYAVLATNYNGGAAPPDNTIDTATLSANWLVTGTNLVAVEIHQQALNSSDLSFDFALTGNVRSAVSPPIITRSPTNQTVNTNGTAIFSVEATGNAPLACQWWHNNQLVESTLGPVLTLPSVKPADAGAYRVVVINFDGMATSEVATLTVPDADNDGDGMLDSWELAHGLSPNDPGDAALDPDHDGQTNVQESIAGTDPSDGASYLKVDALAPNGGSGGFTLQFTAVAERSYSVLYADVVPTNFWAKLEDIAAAATNRLVTVTNSSPTSDLRFYRLVTPAQ